MKLSDLWRKKPKEKAWAPTDQGWLSTSFDPGWWQQDLKPLQPGSNETVEACVSALSQTVAMCPIHQMVEQDNGELVRRRGSGPERTLLNPNEYTTRSAFFNQIIRSIYFYGNGYAVAGRDNNRAINRLYLVDPRNTNGVIDKETGDVYYWISANGSNNFNPDTDQVYGARDVLNIRIHQRMDDPLKGDTPLTVAAKAIAANSAITAHQQKFFNNMSRPSGILRTDAPLTKEQMAQLRESYAEASQGSNSGKVPILGNGLKWDPMSLTSQDAQLIEAFAMTVESITRVFRVPPPLVNAPTASTYNNAETLMNWFLASGLGFLMEHIELELNKLFNLPFDQRLNFDTDALLRSDSETRIRTLGEGVLKGIYAPNEARGKMGLAPAANGDEPRVQQQVVPLSWTEQPAAPAPVAAPEPTDDEVMSSLAGGVNKGLKSYVG